MNRTSFLLFVTCAPGLEAVLGRELAELGFPSEPREGGVELRAPSEGLFRIALGSALAEGIRVRLKSFVARDFDALMEGVGRLPFRAYLRPGDAARVKVVSHRSKLWHSGAIEQRVGRVLVERVGARLFDASVEAEDAEVEPTTVFVRLTGDAVQVSLDATGRLHRRGYRTHVEKASLRETLAAAVVRVARETAQKEPSALWDPFCGAGTVALEAARHFCGIAPNANVVFPFRNWPTHEAELFERTKHEISVATEAPSLRVFASDISERALEATRQNAARAGVTDAMTILHGDFERVSEAIPSGAWIVSNPPYGERLEGAGLMKRLDQVLQRRRDLRPVVLLVGGAAKRELSGTFRSAISTKNGGLDVALRVLEK